MGNSDPIPAVSVALLHEEQILLVRRGRAPALGLFALPGGKVEAGESETDAARRELAEETGLDAADLQPIARLRLGPSGPGEKTYALTVFRGLAHSGVLAAGDDAAEAGWYTLDAIADLPMTETSREIAVRLLGGNP